MRTVIMGTLALGLAMPAGAQTNVRLAEMPGGFEWRMSEDALVARLGQPDRREQLPARGIVRISYAADHILRGLIVQYNFAPGLGLAKGDYLFTLEGSCEEAYHNVASALGAPYATNDLLNFCTLPEDFPLAIYEDRTGTLGVMLNPNDMEVAISYTAPWYESFIKGEPVR